MKKINFSNRYHLTEAVIKEIKTHTRRIKRSNTPPYKVGEIIAIAQSYEEIYKELKQRGAHHYAACLWAVYHKRVAWRNKMFVAADEMLHHIKVVAIREERLQDISDSDCIKEGIRKGEFMNTWNEYYFEVGETYNPVTARTPREAFSRLINGTCGNRTWSDNPMVWVVELKKVD